MRYQVVTSRFKKLDSAIHSTHWLREQGFKGAVVKQDFRLLVAQFKTKKEAETFIKENSSFNFELLDLKKED